MLHPGELFEESRAGEEGTDAVDADLVGRVFGCETFCCLRGGVRVVSKAGLCLHEPRVFGMRLEITHVGYGSLAGVVPDQAGSRSHNPNAGDVDDGASLLLLQELGHHGRCAEKDTLDVDVHDHVELFLRDLQRRFVLVRGPCIVHQYIQTAIPGDGAGHELVPVGSGGHVGLDERDVGWIRGCDALAALGVDVGDDDFGAFGGEAVCYAFAEARAAACVRIATCVSRKSEQRD